MSARERLAVPPAAVAYTSDVDDKGHAWKLVRAKKPKETADGSGAPNSIKVVVLGDSAVGKTALLRRFYEQDPRRKAATPETTIGVDILQLWLKTNHPHYDETTSLQLVDTAGQERFQAVAPQMFAAAHGIFFVFDSTRQATFERICNLWRPMVRERNPYCVCMLVATKFDLYETLPASQRWMDAIDMRKQAARLECDAGFHVVSAVTGQHVDAMMVQMADASIEKERLQYAAVEESHRRRDGGVVLIGNNITVRKTCSC